MKLWIKDRSELDSKESCELKAEVKQSPKIQRQEEDLVVRTIWQGGTYVLKKAYPVCANLFELGRQLFLRPFNLVCNLCGYHGVVIFL